MAEDLYPMTRQLSINPPPTRSDFHVLISMQRGDKFLNLRCENLQGKSIEAFEGMLRNLNQSLQQS